MNNYNPRDYNSYYLSVELLYKLTKKEHKKRGNKGALFTPRLIDCCYRIISDKREHHNIMLCDSFYLSDAIDDILKLYNSDTPFYYVFEKDFQEIHHYPGFIPFYDHSYRKQYHYELKNCTIDQLKDALLFNIIDNTDTLNGYPLFNHLFDKIDVTNCDLLVYANEIIDNDKMGVANVYYTCIEWLNDLQFRDALQFMKDNPDKNKRLNYIEYNIEDPVMRESFIDILDLSISDCESRDIEIEY